MSNYRQTLQRVAERTRLDPDAFVHLERRRHLRHRNRRIVSAVVALAVAAGGTWGALALVNVGRQTGPSTAPRLRTATANGVTVTFPSDWTLVEFGKGVRDEGSHGGPFFPFRYLQLGNYQLGLNSLLLCPSADSMPSNGVLLYIGSWPGTRPAKPSPWPVPPEQGPVESGACGRGHYVDWSVGSVGFQAMLAFGPEASRADREALLAAFRSLDFTWLEAQSGISFVIPSSWDAEARRTTAELFGTHKEVLASVTTGGRRFTFSVMPDALDLFKGEGPTLVLENGDIGPLQPPGPGESMIATRYSNAGRLHIVAGSVTKDVASVDVVTGGRTYPATLVDFPPAFPGAYRGYFFNLDNVKVDGGQIVARDAQGHVVQRLPLF